MDNKKCPNCGFINFLTAECCRKCETPLNDAGGHEPVYSGQGAPFTAYPSPYQGAPPKSGGGFPFLKVFLGLLGLSAILIAISNVTGIGARFRPLSAVAWREFRPPQGRLTVMMPTAPTVGEPEVTPSLVGVITSSDYRSAVEGQGSALYWVVIFPSSLSTGELPRDKLLEDKLLDDELSSRLTRTKATLVSKKRILFEGNPGLEYELRPPGIIGLKNTRGFGKTLILQDEVHYLFIYASEHSTLLSNKDKFLNPIVH